MITPYIIGTFIIGYACIALESVIRINKAAIALLMFALCWTLFMIDPTPFVTLEEGQTMGQAVSAIIEHHLGSTATTLFFLMGAMTIVEVVDQNNGFDFVRSLLATTSKRSLLWRICGLTFVLSAILDNLTTSIVMIMILRKLVSERSDRLIYAALIVIAANSGGAASPIGDVTTIMLWNKGLVTAAGVLMEIILPSIVSAVIPAYLLSLSLKGDLAPVEADAEQNKHRELTPRQEKMVFFVGVGGLIFVPIFKSITHLPPFVGILLVLACLWTLTEFYYRHDHNLDEENGGPRKRIESLLSRIDMSTILFFLGILMAVACLETIGVLTQLGQTLDTTFDGNHYAVTGIIGVLSSIVDNVPLVAGCMGMYPVAPTGDLAVDGIFWQLLAYCAGVGGSMLIIGSAAGVVVMGLEKITFGWYFRRVSGIVLIGYLAGMITYWLLRQYVFGTLIILPHMS